MISNGFDMAQVMAKLFGRIKWRSLNPGGDYPLNYTVGAVRGDLFLKAGTSAGLPVNAVRYTDPTSSLKGWAYRLNQLGYGPLQMDVDYSLDPDTNDWILINGSETSPNQRFSLEFQPQQSISPSNSSGRFYELFHPMCTLNNLKSVIDQDLAAEPAFTTFLGDLEQAVIMALLNGIFNEPQQIESTLIWDRQLRNDNPYSNYGKFVGYRLFIAPGEFALQVSRASFIFNGDVSFNLYLFQDMKKAPLYTIPVTVTGGDELLLDLQDWILNYTGPLAQGGTFYLGYFQNDLGSVQALDQFVTRWNQSLAFGYSAFEADQVAGQQDFVRIQVPYTYRTYGMNLEVQTYKDFTNRIIKNASLFDEAVGLMMAVVVLGYEAYSTRTNTQERNLKDMAAQLYGDINNSGEAKDINPYVAGLKMQIRREIGRIHKNFFGKCGIITTRPMITDGNDIQGVFP